MYKRTIRTGISILLAAAMMCTTVQAAPAEETQELENTAVVSEYEGAVAEEVMPETEDTQEEAAASLDETDVDSKDVRANAGDTEDQPAMDDDVVPVDEAEKSTAVKDSSQTKGESDENTSADAEMLAREAEQDRSFVNAYRDLTIQVERGEGIEAYRSENLPSSYSSVDLGYVTPIKSQSVFGTCWAFAWLAAAESGMLRRGGTKAYDLSELQLAYGAYHTPETPRKGLEGDSLTVSTDDFLNIGGNNLLTTFISAAWIGAVDEEANSEVSWSEADSSYVLPEEYYYNHNAVVLENAYWMMMKDTDTIKKAIMDYGAVASGMYYTVSYVNYKNGVYCYYNHNTKSTNHAVTIVGWDDNFSKENFATEAPGDGAWLIKNSYGTYSGNDGYLWVSYYDQAMSNTNAFVVIMENTHEDNIYQYDGSAYPFSNCSSNYAANVFTTDGKETLKSVAFAANWENVNYNIEIYRGVKDVPTSGMKVYEQSGYETYAGYHKIVLDQDIPLTEGEKFAIVVHLESGSSIAYVLADRTANGGWFKCVSHSEAGQSFTSSDKEKWTDQSAGGSYNCRIKAFTDTKSSESTEVPMTSMTLDQTSLSLKVGKSRQLKVQYTPSNTTDSLDVAWNSSNEKVATVDANGNVQACGVGTAVITCTGSRFSAKCTVTVTKSSLEDAEADSWIYPYAFYYTGADLTPEPYVSYGGVQLTKDVDYRLSYTNNRFPGTATVLITGIGNYEGIRDLNFWIYKALLTESMVSLQETLVTYDGTAKRPAVTVSGLQEGTDYEVQYSNNVNVGTASVTVTGRGNYQGQVTKTFQIVAGTSLYDDVPDIPGWRYDAIKYVTDHGIMNGISGTRNFAPDDPLTRAMFATIIYRMEGSPAMAYTGQFPDVPNGNYFSKPISWTAARGIMVGHSNTGLFGTHENITREDLVTVMYRYAATKGYDRSKKTSLDKFADASQVSGYAREAMQWAVANGIIKGRSNTGLLDPKGNATRVETAAIIQRFRSNIR